jgi:N utilization substance protein B
MALPPQKFREIVFQILYSSDFPSPETEETALMLMGELKVTKKAVLEANGKVSHIAAKLSEIDEKISNYSTDYTFDRISRVEKTILRLAIFELLFVPSLPPLVAIAEAIRMTRKFGTPESAHFVNAILDRVYKNSLVNSSHHGSHLCLTSETV